MVLEAFASLPQAELYICTKIEDDFAQAFHTSLFETPNIHVMGHIRPYGRTFRQLMKDCLWLIFPSASEGSPGSVADCMIQGVIPLVSRSSHIDIDGLGQTIDPCNTASIRAAILDALNQSDPWCLNQSQRVQAAALQRFDPALFRTKLQHFLEQTLS